SVVQSMYYKDPTTSEAREIDVVATADERGLSRLVRYSIVIECKSSKDKPWVMFTSTRIPLQEGAIARSLIASPPAVLTRDRIASIPNINTIPIFARPARAGYNMSTVNFSTPPDKDPGVDRAFKASMSVVNAAVAIAGAGRPNDPPGQVREFAFPVIL